MAAHWQRAAQTDPDLAAIVNAWDRLPEAIRAGIVAMVKAASKREGPPAYVGGVEGPNLI